MKLGSETGSQSLFIQGMSRTVQHYVNPETKRLVRSRGCGLRLGERERYYDFSF